MALIKCPECGHMISDKAVKCPKCGFPIGQETAPAPNHVYPDDYVYDDRTGSSSRKWLFAAIGVLAVAVGIVAFLLLRNGQGQETADTESEKEKTYALAIPELGWLNIRESPSTSSKIVGKMRTCVDEAEVLGKEADWYMIRFDGVVGYINEPFSFVGTKEEVEEYRNTLRMPTYKQVMALWEWAPKKQKIAEEDLSPLADFIPKMKFLKCDIDNEVSASDEYGWDEGNTYSSYWACYGMNITDVSVYDGWNAHFSTDQPRACGIIVQLDRDSYQTQVNLGAYFKDKADAEALFQQLKQNEKWKAENDGGETLYSTSSASTKGIEQKGEWYAICIKGVRQKQERREEESLGGTSSRFERTYDDYKESGWRFLLSHLKSPRSAVLISYVGPDQPTMVEFAEKVHLPGLKVAAFSVDAQNSFGAMINSNFMVFYKNSTPMHVEDMQHLKGDFHILRSILVINGYEE